MRTAWLLLCLPQAALAAPWLRSEGVATSAQGDLLYREVHWRREATEGAERWVLYQCPDGQPFARKHLPASARPQARGYSLEDRRSGQTAEVDAAGDSVSIAWKEDAASELRRRRLEQPPDAVIDAGFDAAVRLHWPALLRGERITLPFLVPARQRYFPVQVRRVGPVRWQGIDAQAIEVSLDLVRRHCAAPGPGLRHGRPSSAGVPRHQQLARCARHLSAGDGALPLASCRATGR